MSKLKIIGVVLLVLSLLITLIPACGGDDDEVESIATSTLVSTITTAPTTTPTATTAATPTPSGPVKIGAICAWSGAAAMAGIALVDPIIKLVEWQVQDMGGILGGRPVKIVKYDNRGSVAEAQAGAQKLYLDEKVSALVIGGISPTEFDAVSASAEENQILFVSIGEIQNLAQKKFSVNGVLPSSEYIDLVLKFSKDVAKPETAAFLLYDIADTHQRQPLLKSELEAIGISTIYEAFVSLDTLDFMPYLTKIKYEKPDILFLDLGGSSEHYITIAKQIMELNGWDDIKVLCNSAGTSAVSKPGADGWYIRVLWLPDQPYTGSVKFQNEFQQVNGRLPSPTHVYHYNAIWTAINAVEMAGTDTDRVAIAQVARSGELEWETPMGHAIFSEDGVSGLHSGIARVENGTLISVPLQY